MSKHTSKKPHDQKIDPALDQHDDLKDEALEDENQAQDSSQDPIDALNKEIDSLQQELSESKNALLRAYADTDNTRKRLQKETEQAKKYRFQSAALELLPILDNLNRALEAKPENPEVENFVKGFEMIRTQFISALQNEGVSEVDALNQPFDPNFMQALQTEKVEGVEPGTVVEVLQKGFKLKDRILRPALVKVSE